MSRANSEAMQVRWDTNHEYREKQSALLRKILRIINKAKRFRSMKHGVGA